MQTKRGADALERQLRNEFSEDAAHGVDPFAGPPPTFAEFSERWMRDYASVRNRPATIRRTRTVLRLHLVPALGRTRLDQVSTAMVERLAATLAPGRNPKTVNNALSVLRTLLRTARRWRVLSALPEVLRLKETEPPYRFLTEIEEQSLVDACAPGFWQTLVVFILHSGVRFSEAAALTWDDLLLDRPQPVVRINKSVAEGKVGPTKSGTHREVPLNSVVLAMVSRLPRWHEHLFPTPTGKLMSPSSKAKYLYRFCDRAQIKRHGWHVLRHTYATRLGARGVTLPVIQKLMGHTTLKMTMRYVHVDPRTMMATAAIVEAAMAAPTGFGHQVVTTPILLGEIRPLNTTGGASESALPSRKPTLEGRLAAWSG